MMSRATASVLLLVLLASRADAHQANSDAAQTGAKHVFGIEDWQKLRSAMPLDVSPDGNLILYQVSYEGTQGPPKREWHTIGYDGSGDRKLELPEQFEPRGFMPDGRSFFGIMEVNEAGQLAIVPQAPGKATQILTLPNGIKDAQISPDGTRFALTADPRAKDPLAKVRTIVENDQSGVYVIGVHGDNGAWWCPELKDVGSIAWSADATKLAILSQSPHIGHHETHSFVDVCSAAGNQRIAEIPNAASGIAWSGGGAEIAFTSTTTDVLTPDHVWTVAVTGGKPVDRTPNLEATAAGLHGDVHGNVWVELHRGVVIEVDRFRNGRLEAAFGWPNGIVFGPASSHYAASKADAMAFVVGDPTHSMNVAVGSGSQLNRITREGDETLANVKLGDARAVHWTSKDGTKLEGIVTFPADYEAGKKYKFLNLPHGGPEANDTLSLDAFARMIAGMGYVVMQPQYRGSTGYGSAFLQALYQHFGDVAYHDVDSATDFAETQGWADPDKEAMFGWSGGGFMTAWTVTQTHRYKAAIEGAGITDWLSFIPTSDISQVDYDLRLQEKGAEPFLKYSAVMFTNQVTTPLLILQGQADLRVPMLQGRELFILLAERGKTVRMVTYPGSPHFPRLAEQRRNVFQEISDWLEKYNR